MSEQNTGKISDINRRKAVKILTALTGATALALAKWEKPVVRVGTMPAYAQASTPSDRNIKDNIQAVDAADILDRVVQMPVSTWVYKTEPDIPHIGPMAQDFRSLFNVGKDDKTIYTVDAQGVAMAAIQGLYQLVQKKDAELSQQQAHIAALEARLEALENRQ